MSVSEEERQTSGGFTTSVTGNAVIHKLVQIAELEANGPVFFVAPEGLHIGGLGGRVDSMTEKALTPMPIPAEPFLGRDAELASLKRHTRKGRIVAVCGVRGSGKTEFIAHYLAAEVAMRGVVEGTPQFSAYIDLDGWSEGPRPVLKAVLVQLGLENVFGKVEGIGEAEAVARVRMAVSARLAGAALCLVFDQIDGALASDAGLDSLRQLLHPSLVRSMFVVLVSDSAPPPLDAADVVYADELLLSGLDQPTAARILAELTDITEEDWQVSLDVLDQDGFTPEMLHRISTGVRPAPGVGIDPLDLAVRVDDVVRQYAGAIGRALAEG